MDIEKAIEIIDLARVEYNQVHDKHLYERKDYYDAFTLAIQALNHMKLIHKVE